MGDSQLARIDVNEVRDPLLSFPGVNSLGLLSNYENNEKIQSYIRKAKLVVIMCGTNDCTRERQSVPIRQAAGAITKLLSKIKDSGLQAHYVKPPPKADKELIN